MARSRNIKPGFFLNEDLVELPFETRLLFIGLWTLADREGRLEYRPKKIKMAIFPADEVDVVDSISQLERVGLLVSYGASPEKPGLSQASEILPYIQIVNFIKHQRPHHRESKSEIPSPEEPGQAPESNVRAALIPDSGYLIPDPLNLIPDPAAAAASDDGGADTVQRTSLGFGITSDWTPKADTRAQARMTGIPMTIFDNAETLVAFRMKYAVQGGAPCRDPAFDKRYFDWCLNEHRNPKPVRTEPVDDAIERWANGGGDT